MKKSIKITILTILIITVSLASACGGTGNESETIRIGHKNFAEQRILGHIYAKLIENDTEYNTKVTEFGGSQLVLKALESDEVDMYGEYTGTAYATVVKQSGENDPDKVFEIVKAFLEDEPYNFLVGNPMGFNNTYTMSVKQETAEKYNLESISDLAEVAGELTLGAVSEFLERQDGLLGLEPAYDIKFKEAVALDTGLRYTAIESGDVDVIDAYSTDGKILQYNLKILEDDKGFFPPYYVISLFNQSAAEKYPDAVAAVAKLEGMITNEEMQQLNYKVDEEGLPESKVAEDFLREKGLID
jgi:osmoprotectant transport system substrate-binding protein